MLTLVARARGEPDLSVNEELRLARAEIHRLQAANQALQLQVMDVEILADLKNSSENSAPTWIGPHWGLCERFCKREPHQANGGSLAPRGSSAPAESSEPTLGPTVAPTMNPTLKPTVAPTMNPTLKPTVAPTMNSTLKPTVAPTMNPTLKPTRTLQCPANWYNTQFQSTFDRLDNNATWRAWTALHFPRERANCEPGRKCWSALYCTQVTNPGQACTYSNTTLCMPAGNRSDTRCKAVSIIECPCTAPNLDDHFSTALSTYVAAYGREWRVQNPQGSDSQFLTQCTATRLFSMVAKDVMVNCMRRSCAAQDPVGQTGTKGGSSATKKTDDFLQLAAGFGGGSYC